MMTQTHQFVCVACEERCTFTTAYPTARAAKIHIGKSPPSMTWASGKFCGPGPFRCPFRCGPFSDHIVPAILYQYTQVLRRPDLLSSKGKPLITKARLETVWTRLADRLSTVVADTSMITISPEYAGHFYDLYIQGKENAKLTGDSMMLLMLTLPFMVSDLIAPEVNAIYPSYTRIMPSITCSYYGRSR